MILGQFRDQDGNTSIHCSCHKGAVNFVIAGNLDKSSSAGSPPAAGDAACGNYQGLEVSVNSLENKCRYHNSLVTYPENNLASEGLCPDAFHAAYPVCLALLYDADFSARENKDSVTVSCPQAGGIELLVKREEKIPLVLRKLIKIFEKIFGFFFYPVDKIYNDVTLKVVSTAGACPRGHKPPEKYFLNIHGSFIHGTGKV